MADLLTNDLIREILSFLPVKSLLRFRCVSKYFYTLIDSPDFVKEHLDHSITRTKYNHFNIVTSGNYQFNYSVSMQELEQPSQILHRPFSFSDQTIYDTIIGSVNGLLCLRDSANIIISNLATRKYHKLPSPPPGFSPTRYEPCFRAVCGFGYDPVSDDYNLLRLDGEKSIRGSYIGNKARLYSLRSHSWQTIQDCPYSLLYDDRYKLEFVCGALHWMVTVPHVLHCDNHQIEIVAFDLATNNYRLVALTSDIKEYTCRMSLGELGGCLSLMCDYIHDRIEVWVMKNFGVKESWSKLFSFSQPEIRSSYEEILTPLTYSKRGDEILLIIEKKKLICYNPETRRMRVIYSYSGTFETSICAESMVSPIPKVGNFRSKVGEIIYI